jgi:hypothetical protein
MIQKVNLISFIIGVLFWPIVLAGCHGDPLHQYFKELESSGMSTSEVYKHLKRQDDE